MTVRSALHRSFAAGLLLACGAALAQPADTVLVNGKIVTLDAKSSVVEALAVRDGRIVALGRFQRVKPAYSDEPYTATVLQPSCQVAKDDLVKHRIARLCSVRDEEYGVSHHA
jgi:hypothetical protein